MWGIGFSLEDAKTEFDVVYAARAHGLVRSCGVAPTQNRRGCDRVISSGCKCRRVGVLSWEPTYVDLDLGGRMCCLPPLILHAPTRLGTAQGASSPISLKDDSDKFNVLNFLLFSDKLKLKYVGGKGLDSRLIT